MKRSVVLMGASVCGIMGYILYLLLKKEDEDSDNDFHLKKSNFKTVEIKIPKDKVRILIGRNGKNIKAIQMESNTRISFKKDEEGDIRTCMIKGTSEACAVAHNLIEDFFSKQPTIETMTLDVPQSCVGRIIGRCGEQITDMSARSGAKIHFNEDKDRSGPTAKVIIKGSKQQIELAKGFIEEVVERASQLDAMLAKREPRSPAKIDSPKTERMSPFPGQNGSQFEVYVSAMIDPSHFWVQIVGPKATQLDQLVEIMSEYYSKDENKELHTLKSIEVGDLVAAQFGADGKWYRAEVLATMIHASTPSVELYYVDYGDTDLHSSKRVLELRTDFLTLNFQAIECYLSGVEPNGNDWSEEALDKFEEWTHVAQWKKLAAKMKGYSARQKTRTKLEGSAIPGIELYDVSCDSDIDIAQELVKNGYAKYKTDVDFKSTSNHTSNNSINIGSV